MAINKMIMDWETTKGQDPASPKPIYVSPSGETGISATRQTKSDEIIGGDIDSGEELYGTFNEISGTTNFPMSYERIGFVMKAILGDASSVDNGDGTYTHTFSSNIDCLPTFLFQETGADCSGGGNQVDRYNGLMGKSISINVSPSGDYNISFSYVGMNHRDSVTDGISELSESDKIVTTVTRIKNEQASLLIDGSTYGLSKDFTLEYNRDTVAEPLIGSGTGAADVYALAPKLSGNISSLFDTSLYTKAKNETPVSMEISFASGSNSLSVKVNEALFGFKTESKKKGDKYAVNFDYTAYRRASTELIKVVLTNNVASY